MRNTITCRSSRGTGWEATISITSAPQMLPRCSTRAAGDIGLSPELLPGYQPSEQGGLTTAEMLTAPDLDVLWITGANPLKAGSLASKPFLVVQEMFLTETARAADVVLPAASAYEK